ncbi:MAG TPA: hypothetical protein VEL31_23335 [Ktedonobacteraceae bacterium]|nr:hypothetical protein [Ktedonobacteraceae bacterium]
MITLPNWLFAALLYFAGVGFCVFVWGIWLMGDELHPKRKDAHKGKDEYQEICDWLIAEIERTLQED